MKPAILKSVKAKKAAKPIVVRLSNELVQLLSEQLYQSPLKAIEEHVVNAYDADASECRIFISTTAEESLGLVFDDGVGMDYEGLVDLWHIGRSNKRSDELQRRRKRTQIGKFGIGKLASFTVANIVTYISKSNNQYRLVTLDFRDFAPDPTGSGKPVELPVLELDSGSLEADTEFTSLLKKIGLTPKDLLSRTKKSWTMVILSELREKAQAISHARLRWVLRTAMPLRSGFSVFLNSEEVKSSKDDYQPVVKFKVEDLPAKRLQALSKATGEKWSKGSKGLTSNSFPEGIKGEVLVTSESLKTGKSSDIGRSHGFFVRVRGRLINEEDDLFGVYPLSHQTFNRFRADLDADDLDQVLTAPREGVELSGVREKFQDLILELFYEAQSKYRQYLEDFAKQEIYKREDERNYVNPLLVEHPIADMMIANGEISVGADADENWFYLDLPPEIDVQAIAKKMYTEPRTKYRYQYSSGGAAGRMVTFNPEESIFTLNADHDLVLAYSDDPQSSILLEDLVTAEALLEVYLREVGLPPSIVGEILERRDSLLRSLVFDHPYSLKMISGMIKDSAANERNLEIALVGAARALGFVAKHVSGAGQPDGVARFVEYPEGEIKITLEAKSAKSVPSLASLDFAGLKEHVKTNLAKGCLLVAPGYPGDRKTNSAVANRARQDKISCWTIDDLALFVGSAESKGLSARHLLDIVLNKFAPEDVHKAVNDLLSETDWSMPALNTAIIQALRALEDRVTDSVRSIDMISGEISRISDFKKVTKREIEVSLRQMAEASKGGLRLTDDGKVVALVSLEELERRLSAFIGRSGLPRKRGTFRDDV